MKPLLRWAFNGLAALSLLLCVATCALWVRSHFRWDQIHRECGALKSWNVATCDEGCFVETNLWNWGTSNPPPWSYSQYSKGTIFRFHSPTWSWPGLAGGTTLAMTLQMGGLPPMTNSGWYVLVDFWLLATATAVLPKLAILRRLRRRKFPPPGLCRSCGYDLRASPDRCPECGTMPLVTSKRASH